MKWLIHLALLVSLFFCIGLFTACPPFGDDDDDDNDDEDYYADDDDDNDDNDNEGCTAWTDPTTGLVWENGEEFFGTWTDAIEYCMNLSCGGYDDWRTPDIDELRSLIWGCEGTVTGGGCEVTDPGCTDYDCLSLDCGGCEEFEGPAVDGYYLPDDLDGDYWVYWSFTEVTDHADYAWIVSYKTASITTGNIDSNYAVRCVRGGM